MHDSVPFLKLGAAYHELRDAIDEVIARVLRSGHHILGPEVDAFEAEYAAYCEACDCIGLANGLDALHFALRAMYVGPGDEVIGAAVARRGQSNRVLAGLLRIECRSINDPMTRKGEVLSPSERIDGYYRQFIVREELEAKLTSLWLYDHANGRIKWTCGI